MSPDELLAYIVFGGYFALIFLSFFLVFKSILHSVPASRLLEGRPFFFLRTAVGALLCTWYFMFKFMAWSHDRFAYLQDHPTIGQWLANTALFEQAWRIVCTGASNWWWSSFICTWTVIYTAIIWRECGRRDILYPWAYMLLGMLVAISVSTSLFITSVLLHPPRSDSPKRAPPRLWICLAHAMLTVYLLPRFVNTDGFLGNLLAMHGLLGVPLLLPLKRTAINGAEPAESTLSIPFPALYALLVAAAAGIHLPATTRLIKSLPLHRHLPTQLFRTMLAHPAQTSISMDVLWVFATLLFWFVTSGSTVSIVLKVLSVAAAGLAVASTQANINWALVGSIMPIVILLSVGLAYMSIQRIRTRNAERRKVVLDGLGIIEDGVVPGTKDKPPSKAGKKVVVGFWHPYCNAGGGGERVLWSAIRALQKGQPDVVCLVYSGDYPAASKDEILAKVQDRFSINLSPDTLHFVPLPSRHFISDNYWRHFTLLGQSLGSVLLAWEGLCGKDGLWGDVFLDSMGYAFTFPFVRLIAGSQIAIGAYIHYPTVSADMVKRVRERVEGVENAGASKSWLRTQVKLLYYAIFTCLYSTSLLFSEQIMTNSSWTQAHIKSLLTKGRASWLAGLFLLNEPAKGAQSTIPDSSRPSGNGACEVVYPPCDTEELVKLGRLDRRERKVVSLAQFRPEKEHAKQLHAFAKLYEEHPEYRSGEKKVTLTMMGGARDAADQARLEGLKALAYELGIEQNVEFLVNAPYAEIVRRLGEASVGLNTMQDEHFGINVVEFMAAGLIPVVHASAGPLMDIVVPYKGQRAGFHATDAPSFAEAIHQAFSLPPAEAKRTREAARKAAVERFSQKEFERGFERHCEVLRALAVERKTKEEAEAERT